MKVKITIRTTAKQRDKQMENLKKNVLGFGNKFKVIAQEPVSEQYFYWIVELNPKDLYDLTSRVAKAEVSLKQFFKKLFWAYDRALKLKGKFEKGWDWMAERFKHNMKGSNPKEDAVASLMMQEMGLDPSKPETFKIDDRAEMEDIISGDIFKVEDWN
jgi:hypothetical protein